MYRSTPRILLGAVVTTLVWLSVSSAQFSGPQNLLESINQFLIVDHAYFRSDEPDLTRLELYYQIYNHGLQFTQEGNEYVADYELTVTVDDNGGNRLETITRDRQLKVETSQKAGSRSDFRTSQVNVHLPPGKYKVEFSLLDKSSGEITKRELKVKLESLYERMPRVSGVEFARAFNRKTDKAGVFDKTDMVVVPSVTRTYGEEGSDRLAYYFEVYPGSDSIARVVIETKVRHATRGLLYRDTLHLLMTGATEKQLREISLRQLTPGEYEMELILRGRRNKKLHERRLEFEVLWTQEGMLVHDWKTAVAQLELIAELGEVGHMKELTTLPERTRAFEEFWAGRDPTVGTVENEAKTAFYRRVATANHNFRILRKPGWRTDRGRIYIRYGTPDQIDDEPFAPNALPYQVWHYYTSGTYRRYLFVDENEDGDYRLQYPYDGLYQRPDF
jgi:GWxTD domain-containing protein